MIKRKAGAVWAFAAMAIVGSASWALGWIGAERTDTASVSLSPGASNEPPIADAAAGTPAALAAASLRDAEAAWAAASAAPGVGAPWMDASLAWINTEPSPVGTTTQASEKDDEVDEPDFQSLTTELLNCPSVMPPQNDPGDPVSGAWASPNQPSTSWSLFKLWTPAKGNQMQVVWHTYYPKIGGGATWLISDPAVYGAGEDQDGTVVYSAALRRPRFNVTDLGPQVGRVDIVFPSNSATRASVRWTWYADNKEDGTTAGSFGATQCIYLFGSDTPPASLRGPDLLAPPPTLAAPPDLTAQGAISGIWNDPSVPGYQIVAHQVTATELAVCAPGAPVVDCVPSDAGFPDNPNKPGFKIGYAQFYGLDIYTHHNVNAKRRPLWLYAQMGPYPNEPSTLWKDKAPSDYESTVVEISYLTANYLITEECTGPNCVTPTVLAKASPLQNGHFFGRAFHTARQGVIGLKADLSSSTSSPNLPSIDWPPSWPSYVPDASTAGCNLGTDICRPVRMAEESQIIVPSRTTCDLLTPTSSCDVTLQWNSMIGTTVERVSQASNALVSHGGDGGLVSTSPWGAYTDTLSDGEFLKYRLKNNGKFMSEVSVSARYSTITASNRCLLVPVPGSNTSKCVVKVNWRTPDPDGSNLIVVQRFTSVDNGQHWQGAGLLRNGVANGTDVEDTIEVQGTGNGPWVYYALRRAATPLSDTSPNPTITVRASITATPRVCPVSLPLGQTSCPVTVNWIAAEGATIYRMNVGAPGGKCTASSADCVRITPTADGAAIDNLPVGSNVYYVVMWGVSNVAQTPVVATATSSFTIDGNATGCTVLGDAPTCSITVRWNSVAAAKAYRVDNVSGGRTQIPALPQDACAGACAVEHLAPGERVHYELMINEVLHAITPEIVGKLDTEEGDSNTGNEEPRTSPAAFVVPTLDTESDQVGAIAGEFRVDEGGNAVYRIPLAVPAGAGGLSPSMALVYNSSGSDGSLGTGFSLEGASAILPCRPSAEAGDAGKPSADPNQFCLDGQRLLWVGGSPHRQAGAIYRTEIETFQRITLTAIQNPNVQDHDATGFMFTVEGKDGSVRTYGGAAGTVSGVAVKGNTSTSGIPGENGFVEPQPIPGRRITAQGWLLTQLRDVAGNAIAFQYSAASGAGERYLENVTYSGGSVTFRYMDSTTRRDVAYSLLGPHQQSKLISGIEIKAANGSTLRYYEPSYNTTVTDPYIPSWSRTRPILTSLKECSSQGGVCYPATTLTWSFALAPTDDFEGTATLAANAGGYYKLGDLNGDGRTDLWWTSSPNGNDNARLHISAFTGDAGSGAPTLREVFTSASLFPDGYNNGGLWEVLDFNGDGRDDLLFAYASCGEVQCCPPGSNSCPEPTRMNWKLRLSTGAGLETQEHVLFWVDLSPGQVTKWANRLAALPPSPNGTLRALGSSMLADVDGDGMSDLLFRANDGAFWVALMRRTGVSSAPYQFQVLPTQFLNESGNPIGEDPNTCYVPGDLTRTEENYSQATDFDGDGRADLRFLVNAQRVGGVGCGGWNEIDLQIFLAKGVQTNAGPFVFQAARPFGALPAIYGDVYDEEDNPNHDNPAPRVRTLDVNGDGLADLVYRPTKDAQWRYRLGGPYAADRDLRVIDSLDPDGTVTDHNTLQLLDFDGDGKLDWWEKEGAQGRETYTVRLWRGDNWTGGANTSYKVPQPGWTQAMGDFDGDGAVDSLKLKLGDRDWKLQRSKGHHKPRGVVTEITNGFGAKTTIDYAPLTFSSVYRRDYDAPLTTSGRGSPVFDVASPNYVVRSVTSSAPTQSSGSAESQMLYRYAGLKVQAGGRGSLGFRRVTSYDVQNSIEVNSHYQQRFPYSGLPDFTETRNLDTLGFPGDACAGGQNPASRGVQTADSTQCMPYTPPCTTGLASCDSDLRDITNTTRLIRSASDTWQWRKSSQVGALTGICADRVVGTFVEGMEIPQSEPDPNTEPSGSPCSGVWLEPDERDRRSLSTSVAPIFLARLQSQISHYDLVGGANAGPVSSETAEFLLADYDSYGNPKAGKTSKSDDKVTVTTASKFAYDNTESNWRLGRLRTASVVTTRVTKEGSATTISSNARRSSFGYDDKGRLASEKVEGVSGASPDGPVDAQVPAVAKYYYYDSVFGNRTKTFACSTTIPEQQCRLQDGSGSNAYSFHPATEGQVMRHSWTTYDSSGRFVDESSELFSSGLGAVAAQKVASRVGARNAAGDPTQLTDVNAVRSEIRYGALGRKRYTWTADGSSTRWDARFCERTGLPAGTPTVPCPQNMGLVYRATTTKVGAPAGIAFYDRLGRPTITLTQGFAANSWVGSIVQYDDHGNVSRQSDPYFARDTGLYAHSSVTASIPFTETTYDALDRPTSVYHTGTGATTTIAYAGLKTTTTLPPNKSGAVQTKIEFKDALGEVVRTIDANNFEVLTRYDAGGNPEEVRRGSQVTSMTYDSLGRKKTMLDPDAGSGLWVYRVNGAGEVIRQTSPQGTYTTQEYDGRGRVWRRRDYTSAGVTESESTWTYDTALSGKGALAQESNGQVTRLLAYDDLGRPQRRDTTLDGKSYTEKWVFDAFGRPFQSLFQAPGQPWTGERQVYSDGADAVPGVNGGYLRQVRSAYPTSDGRFIVYRQIEALNARGQVEREQGAAGSEYTQTREFNPNTGRLERLLAQSPTAGVLQDIHYSYDLLGNLDKRIDSTSMQVLNEEFHYDRLQRLTTSAVTAGGVTFYARSHSYALDGNLTSKTDVGTYVYGTRPNGCGSGAFPGPHALSEVGTTGQCYDKNGNVVRQVDTSTGREVRKITYNAADQAVDLVHNDTGARVGFAYGPNRERVRRLDYDGALAQSASTVVHYVGGAEIRYLATANNGAGALREVRRTVGNVLVVQDVSRGAYQLKRLTLLTDFQGSTHRVLSAMTQQPVAPVASTSFDA
ncbi:toxin TcdB middle/N-terminal domain-containing protein, partial [Dokdonella ginsengisoli]